MWGDQLKSISFHLPNNPVKFALYLHVAAEKTKAQKVKLLIQGHAVSGSVGSTLSPDDSEVKITWLCSYSCDLDLPEPAFPALCYMYQFIPNHKSTKLLKNV